MSNVCAFECHFPSKTTQYQPYQHLTNPNTQKHSKGGKGIIEETKSLINNIIGKTTNTTTPAYPTHNAYQVILMSVTFSKLWVF